MLAEVRDFVRWDHYFVMDQNACTLASAQQALLIACKVDRIALCVVSAAICFISVVGGVVLGLVLHRPDLGITISSLFAAALSTIEVLLIWF